MGLVAKSLTKRKVAPESAPDNVAADSTLERSLLGAARVRAAMLGRDLAGVSSQTRRGSVSTFAFGTASSFWFERRSDAQWRVTLGTLNTRNQRTVDWSLQVDRDSEERVVVTTPEYLTNNDELVNPRVYDAIRSGLLDAFAYEDVAADSEIALTEQSLTRAGPARSVTTSSVRSGPVRVRVDGSIDEVKEALARIGLPCVLPSPDEFVWTLGLGDGRIRLSISTGQTTTTLKGALVIDETSPYRRACAERGATAWRDRGMSFLRQVDPDSRLEWPEAP